MGQNKLQKENLRSPDRRCYTTDYVLLEHVCFVLEAVCFFDSGGFKTQKNQRIV